MLSKDLLARLDVLAAKATDPHDAEALLEAATAIRTLQQGLPGSTVQALKKPREPRYSCGIQGD